LYDIENLYIAYSVEEAVRALRERPGAKPVAGGTDILVSVREGKLAGCSLVDIRNIDELRGISSEEGAVRIGPLTTFSQLAEDKLIMEFVPILAEAALTVGGPQLRNTGTIGGNIANGATSADMAPALLALNAELTLVSPTGVRCLPLTRFYVSAGKTVLAPDELITGLSVSVADYEGYFGHYVKYSQRNAMDIATLSCACLCKLSPDRRTVIDVRLAFGVAGPVPMRAFQTEEKIRGLSLREALVAVGKLAAEEIDPRTSWRASREFRLALAQELSRRTLEKAVLTGGGVFDV